MSMGGFASGRWVVGAPTEADGIGAVPSPGEATTVLDGHRAFRANAVRGREVWFDFASLVETPSYSEDFLNLADEFGTWVLTGVPALSQTDRPTRERFVKLIDVLVDRDVKVTVFSEVTRKGFADLADPPVDLYRCVSRLSLLGE